MSRQLQGKVEYILPCTHKSILIGSPKGQRYQLTRVRSCRIPCRNSVTELSDGYTNASFLTFFLVVIQVAA